MLSKIGGLPLEHGWPCSGPLLRLAERVANKLMPAFNTYTGMPFGTVNLKWGLHRSETPITCMAGIGTYLLEFGALSRLTGSPHLERVAMKALMELWKHRSAIGLVGNHINVQTGAWTATDAGIGAGVDSYFEYLVKGAVMFEKPELMRQFREYQQAINTYVKQEDWFVWVRRKEVNRNPETSFHGNEHSNQWKVKNTYNVSPALLAIECLVMETAKHIVIVHSSHVQ